MIEDKSNKQSSISHEDQRSFHEFVFESSSEYFNKLQILAPALKRSVPMYREEGEKLLLECCICGRGVRIPLDPANKKTNKKYLAEQILTHIYCTHYN